MNIYKSKLFRLFLLILLLVPFRAYSSEIEYEVDGFTFSAKPRNEEINKSHLTIMGLTIRRHSLKDIQDKLGNTEVLQDEECSTIQICYRSSLISDGTVVVFETDAMGGWEELTTIHIFSEKEKFPKFNHCKKSVLISKDVQTKSGLKLGIKKKYLKRILGEQTKYINNNDLFYIYETKRKMTDEEIERMTRQWPDVKSDPYFDEFSYIHARFAADKMTYFSISKTESY